MPELAGALAGLPLAASGFAEPLLHTCERLGVATVGDLMRLPREGLARRLAPEVPLQLDEALGRMEQPRRRHVPAERFVQRQELPADLYQPLRIKRSYGW